MTRLQILQELIALLLRATMIPVIMREVFQRNKVTIILYHRIPARLFEKHLQYLLKRYSIISLEEFTKAKKRGNMKKLPAKPIIITFDDGAKMNRELQEVLQRYIVPVTIFVCSDIVGTNRHFWFSYRNKIKKDLKTIADTERLKLLSQVGFDEKRDYDTSEALSEEEIADLINVGVSIQSHTLTHPILPMCDDLKAEIEITKSKFDLEKKFGIKVDYFSYPNGNYLPRDIDICERSGYLAAVTVDLGFNDINTNLYKLKRISIYDNASVNQLIVRATGVWSFVKRIFKF
jgi:peptidoglycan/xylan/chitin deacetylase (PgdA/CDA1 family)